jgi:NAD(P)-dependent dehydrogenase (short-subunit alcohol dehydrogenase family)
MGASLGGKLALVTGGGRGIGLACARGLAAAGARVVVTGRRADDLQAAARELGGEALMADLSSRAATDDLVARLGAIGRIDILVNNAGVAESAPLELVLTDELMGPHRRGKRDRAVHASRARSCRRWRSAGWGRLVNIASQRGPHRLQLHVGVLRLQARRGGPHARARRRARPPRRHQQRHLPRLRRHRHGPGLHRPHRARPPAAAKPRPASPRSASRPSGAHDPGRRGAARRAHAAARRALVASTARPSRSTAGRYCTE